MMLAHGEMVAGQRIECLVQRGRLRVGEIAGVGQSGVLMLQQPLGGRLAQEREGLRKNQREWRGEQFIQQPGRGLRRVLLDA